MKMRDISSMDTAGSIERRAFLKALTATTAALTLGGCGATDTAESEGGPAVVRGSGSGPGPGPGGNSSPVWQTVPTITFAHGIASSVSIAAYVFDSDGDPLTITKNAVALPAGVTYEAANKRFVYDGAGAIGSMSGVVLTADDGQSAPASSSAFAVAVATIGNLPPVWQTVPTIAFAQGVAGSISIAAYATDPNGDPLTINMSAGTLPPGVIYDQPNKRFVYDGIGAVASTSGVVLTADDGQP